MAKLSTIRVYFPILVNEDIEVNTISWLSSNSVRVTNILNNIIDALQKGVKKTRSASKKDSSRYHFVSGLVAYNTKVTAFFVAFGWIDLGGFGCEAC